MVLVDEAHRSQASALHANLLKALPNCARIGFTGTPIIMGRRKYTATIFGEYLDQYTILQSEADGRPCRSCTRAAPRRPRSGMQRTWMSCSRTCSPSTPPRN